MDKQLDYNQDAIDEMNARIDEVLATRDVEGARALSEIMAAQDDMEAAEQFRNYATQWEREDWAYDNAISN